MGIFVAEKNYHHSSLLSWHGMSLFCLQLTMHCGVSKPERTSAESLSAPSNAAPIYETFFIINNTVVLFSIIYHLNLFPCRLSLSQSASAPVMSYGCTEFSTWTALAFWCSYISSSLCMCPKLPPCVVEGSTCTPLCWWIHFLSSLHHSGLSCSHAQLPASLNAVIVHHLWLSSCTRFLTAFFPG